MIENTKLKSPKFLWLFVISLLLAVGVAYAGGPFREEADRFFQKICSEPESAVGKQAFLCDLRLRLDSTERRVTTLENNPRPSIKVFDKNGRELGLFVDEREEAHEYRVMLPNLNRTIYILHNSGASGTINRSSLRFSGTGCQGTAFQDNPPPMHTLDNIIEAGANRFFKIDSFTPVTTTVNSYLRDGQCTNITTLGVVFPASPVTLPFSFPVPAPLILEIR